jgi:hypothetical protein
MQETPNKNEMIEKIARRIKCTTCGRRYRPYDFTVLEDRGHLAVMRIVCRECHKQSVVVALVQRHKVRSVFTELEPQEWQRFRSTQPLSRDDVITMHRQMTEYDGDFTDVLEDFLPPEP